MGIGQIRQRKIVKPGQFIAYIAATDLSPGPSAHAWEIYRAGCTQPEDNEATESDRFDSDENRGFATGAFRTVEATPNDSSLEINTPSDYVVKAIEEWLLKWRKNGWRKTNGEPIAHREWWQRFDDECKSRNISVKAYRVDAYNLVGIDRCERLKQRAKKLLLDRQRQT